MSSLSVRLPELVHRKLKQMAEKEGVSMNQLISLAVAKKLSSLLTVDYLNERANSANPEEFKKLSEFLGRFEVCQISEVISVKTGIAFSINHQNSHLTIALIFLPGIGASLFSTRLK
jgi:hypothetical protein